jgi:hypothetical protein
MTPPDNETPTTESLGTPSPRVKFHYLKSSHFRVVHVDGVIGGLAPRGFLHLAVYSERPALPRLLEYQVEADGLLSAAPVAQEGREGVVREMEVDLVMDLTAAIALHHWLGNQLESILKAPAEQAQQEEGG